MKHTVVRIMLALIGGLAVTLMPARAQSGAPQNPNLPQVVGAAPDVAAIEKFVDVPVSLYNGIPSVNVPIYELKAGGITVPIALNYHASGFKVEETPGWVGMNWALNAGGMVSRTVRGGQPDESTLGLWNNPYLDSFYVNNVANNTPLACNDLTTQEESASHMIIQGVISGCYEIEPDLWHYSAPGLGGKFTYRPNKQKVLHNNDPILIQDYFNDLATLGNNRFIITNLDGTQYYFGRSLINDAVYIDMTTNTLGTGGGGCSTMPSVSSWHLAAIVSPDKRDTVFFQYTRHTIIHPSASTTTTYQPAPGSGSIGYIPPVSSSTSQNRIDGWHLKTITSTRGHQIDFQDASINNKGIENGYRLSQVQVWQHGRFIKKAVLNHGFFTATETTANSLDKFYLRLDKVHFEGSNGTALPPYEFNYFGAPGGVFPKKNSRQQDWWGFFNGSQKWRIPNLAYAQAASLKKVTYPTGGYANFSYELNSYSALNTGTHKQKGLQTQSFTGSYGQTTTNTLYIKDNTTRLWASYSTPCANLQPNCKLRILQGTQVVKTFSGNAQTYMYLDSGTYTIEAVLLEDATEDFSNQQITLELEWLQTDSVSQQRVGGGIRIKEIQMYSGPNDAAPMVRRFDYTDNATGLSSGRLKTAFKEYYTIHADENGPKTIGGISYPCNGKSSQGGVFFPPEDPNLFYVYAYNSAFAMTQLQSGYVGYGQVTEFIGLTNDYNLHPAAYTGTQLDSIQFPAGGKVEHFFTNITASDNDPVGFFPITPPNWQDYKYGLDQRKIMYKFTAEAGQQYVPVSETQNQYTFVNQGAVVIPKYGQTLLTGCPLCFSFGFNKFAFSPYNDFTGRSQLASTTQTTYGQQGQIRRKTQTTYQYNAQYLPTKTTQTVLANNLNQVPAQTITTHTAYPTDYNLGGVYDSLLAYRWLSTPIEQKTFATYWKTGDSLTTDVGNLEPTVATLTGLVVNGFRLHNGLPIQDTVYALSHPGGLEAASLDYALQNNKRTQLLPNSNLEPRIAFLQYDNLRNPLSMAKVNGAPMTYLWNYNKEYPVAQAMNAQPNEVAFTSFETNDHGGWNLNLPPQPAISRTVYAQLSAGPASFTLDQAQTVTFGINITELPGFTDPVSARLMVYNAANNLVFDQYQSLAGQWQNYSLSLGAGNYTLQLSFVAGNMDPATTRARVVYTETPVSTPTFANEAYTGFRSSSVSLSSNTLPQQDYVVGLWVQYNSPLEVNDGITVNGVTQQLTSQDPSAYAGTFEPGWYYMQWQVPNTTQVSITTPQNLEIDEVRLHPAKAQITTYCYLPGIGMVNQTGPDGKTMRYEYDPFNRLQVIRDYEGNIVTAYEYQYQVQQLPTTSSK